MFKSKAFVLYRQVRADGKDKHSVVSFTLTDEPQHVDLQTSNSKDEVRTRETLIHSKLLLIFCFFPQLNILYVSSRCG